MRNTLISRNFHGIQLVVRNQFIYSQGKASRNLSSSQRGPIKKVRFAPGRGNLKLLVLQRDAVSIWDIKVHKIIDFPLIMLIEILVELEALKWAWIISFISSIGL